MDLSKYAAGLLDFHNHTTYSDGGDTPLELVQRAKQAGVSAMALTDHNVIGGLEEFLAACKQEDIFAIPFGTEIYAELPDKVLTPTDNEAPDLVMLGKNPKPEHLKDYHNILGKHWREYSYPEHLRKIKENGFTLPGGFDEKALPKELETFRIPWIIHHFVEQGNNVERLYRFLQERDAKIGGKEITLEDVKKQPIRYLNKFFYAIGCPGYVRRLTGGFGVEKAVELADAMNCKLFIAHPGGEYGWLTDAQINYFIEKGIHGIEIRSYFNTAEQNKKFDEMAEKHNLLRSGGSDCHGDSGPFKIGMHDRPQNQLPKEILEQLLDSLP